MNKSLKDIGYCLGLGCLSFVLFLCLFYDNGNITGGLVRTMGMAFATVPLIFAGLSFGYTGLVVSFLGAAVTASFCKNEYFTLFKQIYLYSEMLPAVLLVLAGLPVKNKQISIGGIATVISVAVAAVVGILCFMLNRNYLSAYNYDGTTEVSTFLMSVLEKSQVGERLAYINDGIVIKIIAILMPILPAFVAMTLVGRILLTAYFGMEAALYTKTSRRKKEDFLSFRTPDTAVIISLACAVMILITKGLERYLYWNLTIITAIPLALAGMTKVHNFCKDRKFGRIILAVFYVAVIFTDIWGLFATILIGAYSWIMEKKFIKKA